MQVEALSGEEQERLLAILDFWHKLEFFIPFDLEKRAKEADEGRVRWLQADDRTHSSSELWSADLPDDYELKGFDLYLGVFDTKEITKICEQAVRSQTHVSLFDEVERADLKGRTCFAKLTISQTGELVFKSEREATSVSSVPWALGKIQVQGLSALNYTAFEESKERLGELLQSFRSYRKANVSGDSKTHAHPLTFTEILDLHRLFCEWAKFSPSGNNAIAMREVRAEKKKGAPGKKTEREEESDQSEELEPHIDILNSFFIQDLERVAATVSSGYCPPILKSYLTPLAPEQRSDLNLDEGYWAIFGALHPKRMNRGHWFGSSDRAMSLMQQFAINSAIETRDSPGLFSVNGPPGTGKTTLLQDLFAENIVRRARVLSCLEQAGDAFHKGSFAVRFSGDSNPTSIVKLKPELTGFEMVVASSNNAAVENISRDIPKRGKLGAEWSSVTYLQSVAHKIAAQGADGSFTKLAAPDVPWGLISCVLGNAGNRRNFKERFFFMELERNAEPTWCGPDQPQTIYRWIREYRGPRFAEAAANFKAIHQQVQVRCERLGIYANLLRDKLKSSDAENIADLEKRLAEAFDRKDQIQAERYGLEASRSKLHDELAMLREDERLIERSSPGWWEKLRRTPKARLHRELKQENATAQLNARQQLASLEKKHDASLLTFNSALGSVAQAEQDLEHAQAACSLRELEWARIREEFTDLKLPEKLTDLRTDEFQKEGLWHDRELASLRSSLFASGLALHEAWLAEVAKKKEDGGAGFGGNLVSISKLLSNKRPDDKSRAALIWQSLFMVVPVVSTTFASFANQFRDLEASSLGWLFIDEAGQAVPQAAVGAVWRAQHAVVVGDPRQIEPVFTLPSRFISTLAELSPHTIGGDYAPHQASVQGLADNANRYGTYLLNGEEAPIWIGSPLRVHRRCIEPMFSWSNRIAYDNRMVLGLETREEPNGPPISCESMWIDIGGKTRKQQAVPEQTQFVVELLVCLYQQHGKLPSLYVISPFRAIKNELMRTLKEADWTRERVDLAAPKKQELKKWCTRRVGTVHTFQGKEEDTVIMVLGGDPEHLRAVEWASSKPNILNVALTRAKRRFYLVGDRQLWAMGSFQISEEKFSSMRPDQFLGIVRNRTALARSAAT